MLRSRSPGSLALQGSSAPLAKVGLLALVVLAGLLALAPRAARAQECQPLREVRPLPDELLPANGYIWDVCYYVVNGDREDARSNEICAAPRLFDAGGAEVALALERRADAPPTRLVSRYRPLVPLQVGASYSLEPGEYVRPSGRRTVRVVAATEEVPEPPRLLSLDYQVRGESALARFRFADFDGLLVKDVGAQGQPSLGGVDISRLDPGAAPELELLKQPCRENFSAQRGASAMVRFGVLDLAGNFSGWGETESVQFPATDTELSEPSGNAEEEAGAGGGCSLRGCAGSRAAGLAVLLMVAELARTRRRRIRAIRAPGRARCPRSVGVL